MTTSDEDLRELSRRADKFNDSAMGDAVEEIYVLRDEVEQARSDLKCACMERDQLRADVERMRPVYDAAHQYVADWGSGAGHQGTALLQACKDDEQKGGR